MSILNSTRINFFGGIEVDVSVPNNTGTYPIGKDGADEQIFDPKTSTLTDFVYENNITDEQIIDMLKAPASNGGSPYFTNGGWNIYGQHLVTTNQVKVRSSGDPGQVTLQSPIADLPFYLLGSVDPINGQSISSAVMVDLNPLGSLYSQIALGGIMVGEQQNPLLHLQGDRIVGNQGLFRKIIVREGDSPGSSMFAGSWQVTYDMAKEVVAFGKTGNQQQDQFIEQFLSTPGATGVVVSFSFFEMCPKMTTDEVRKSYGTNENERNPSVGRIIGTIGLAFEGETAEYPDGRVLNDTATGVPVNAQVVPLRADSSALSVNLSIALTQQEFRSVRDGYTADTLNPAIDAGTLSVFAGNTQIGDILPNYSDYYLFGGIVDMAMTKEQSTLADTHQLSVRGPASTASMTAISLMEQPYRIFSDSKDVYMGERACDTDKITLEVRYLGKAVPDAITIVVTRVDVDGVNTDHYLDFSTNTIDVPKGQTSVSYTLQNALGKDGAAGWEQVQFAYGDQASFVVNTRKFEFTNFGIAKGATITWDDAYKHALRYHYLNFLGMSTIFPLNLAQTIQQNKDGIKARTSSQYWPTTLYMPIVRSMSPSQVRIINAFSFGIPWDPEAEI